MSEMCTILVHELSSPHLDVSRPSFTHTATLKATQCILCSKFIFHYIISEESTSFTMSRPEELETTLLEDRVHAHDLEDGFEEEGEDEDESISHFTGQVRLNHSTSALAATIIGAGIVALPRAFATLGLLLGGVLLTVVFSLSFFSLSALIRAAQAAKCWTYDALARSQFGFLGSGSLDLSIVANNTGSMIIYLIIIGDVLVGAPPHYSGLVTNLFGIHSGDVVWVSRPFVVRVYTR